MTTLTDSTERAILAVHEQRISRPLPLPGARQTARWFLDLIPRDRRAHRLLQLELGLVLFGASDGLMLMSGLGATPWDVFHQGLSRNLGLAVGTWVILVGAAVMLLWIPLRQKPGFGTLSNVVVIGIAMNATMSWVPTPHALWLRWAVLLGAIGLNGVATGAYIGAGMGPGPRDGLMTGYAARGHSIRLMRTSIEIVVVASGWLLGGNRRRGDRDLRAGDRAAGPRLHPSAGAEAPRGGRCEALQEARAGVGLLTLTRRRGAEPAIAGSAPLRNDSVRVSAGQQRSSQHCMAASPCRRCCEVAAFRGAGHRHGGHERRPGDGDGGDELAHVAFPLVSHHGCTSACTERARNSATVLHSSNPCQRSRTAVHPAFQRRQKPRTFVGRIQTARTREPRC